MTTSSDNQKQTHPTQTTRIFTPARIVAIALIALAVLGLAYLRFGPEAGSASVPAGAMAGDLILEPGSYATERGSYEADVGTLVVPENRADPGSRLIALPVIRIRSRSDHPAEPIFRLQGGPGLSNMVFPEASRLADRHDVVLVGYRGVDGSSVLDAPEVVTALKHSADFLGEKSLRAYSEAFRAAAKRLRAEGVDLAGYTLAERVDDLEAARVALGYGRIDLLSESVGTRTAMIYSWRYPESIQRSVMIAVNPPGHFLWDGKTTDEQIRRYAGLYAEDHASRDGTGDLAASMRRTAADMPDHWAFLPIQEGNVRLASFFALMESTSEPGPLSAPAALHAWRSAAKGDASGFWFMSLLADLAFPESFVWGDLAAVSGSDARAADDYFSSGGDRGSILGNPGTEFLFGGGGLLDAWPANPDDGEYDRVRTSQVETLLIGGTLDFATPPRVATDEVLPHLPNGHQVVLAELGHTGDFWTYRPEASTRLMGTFFANGSVDDSLYARRAVDFTPEVTHTALAKGIAGTMAGTAILAVLSLLWMARRVHKRGGFGPTMSAVLRSLYPIVLGLGGWFLGALAVMITSPTIPLDNAVLAEFSVGVPIGLGVYYAWVGRGRPTAARTAGFVAAMSGALVAGWLGFHATAGLLALITTIVGATLGANLALIVLDVARERSDRARLATAEPGMLSMCALAGPVALASMRSRYVI